LAEAIPDPMYLQAAAQSAQFLQSHLLASQGVVEESISGRANDSCQGSSTLLPWNSGLLIEQLAVLTSITANTTTQAL
jgi:hypothetical protein